MNTQPRLFTESRHLEADYFLSGNPQIPDPCEGSQWVYPEKELAKPKDQSALFYGELGYNGEDTTLKRLGEVATNGS